MEFTSQVLVKLNIVGETGEYTLYVSDKSQLEEAIDATRFFTTHLVNVNKKHNEMLEKNQEKKEEEILGENVDSD